jgi:hypothetical protein
MRIPNDYLVIGLVVAWLVVLVLLIAVVLLVFFRRSRSSFAYPVSPLEEVHRGLTRLVEEADWLEGDRLINAVRYVAIAKEAVDRAGKACGRSRLGQFHVPSPLVHALDDNVEILGGSSSVITFNCRDCGQEVSGLVQFPKVGGRPETTEPIVVSATSDWRETGFTASAPCKRCKKLLSKKYLYDSLPV